jgi:hypothetical protein
VCLSVCVSVCVCVIGLRVCLFVSACCVCACLSVCVSVFWSRCLSLSLSLCLLVNLCALCACASTCLCFSLCISECSNYERHTPLPHPERLCKYLRLPCVRINATKWIKEVWLPFIYGKWWWEEVSQETVAVLKFSDFFRRPVQD